MPYPDALALDLLSTVPQIMKVIRQEMRRARGDLSVPQFRVLAYLRRSPGASLVEIAEYLGLTSPSISVLVDGLVSRGLVARSEVPGDRRRISLLLTGAGEQLNDAALASAQRSLVERMRGLSDSDLELMIRAMELLRPLFVGAVERPPEVSKP